eukprot:c25567_g1_i1 orf=1-216(-)
MASPKMLCKTRMCSVEFYGEFFHAINIIASFVTAMTSLKLSQQQAIDQPLIREALGCSMTNLTLEAAEALTN